MTVRIRPATTLAVLLGVACAFQLIATLSVPVTKSITLCTYNGYKFGVFGICSKDTCSAVSIGYSGSAVEAVEGFSLPSNARRSISKLLVVHPIGTGFTFVSFICSIILHFHGPSMSLKLLFAVLLWTIPSFLLCLLSFLVDILLFIPHLDWGGWIVLAASVMIAISSMVLCIMRRTVSSRRAMRMNNLRNSYGADYQLTPLNYGYGTVDGDKDDDEDEDMDDLQSTGDDCKRTSTVFDTSIELNNYPATTVYDTSRPNSDVLTPVSNAYRGSPYSNGAVESTGTVPYPTTAFLPEITEETAPVPAAARAPYPQTDLLDPGTSRYYDGTNANILSPGVGAISTGIEVPLLPSEMEQDEPSAPPLAGTATPQGTTSISRQPTYRTRIEEGINKLQEGVVAIEEADEDEEEPENSIARHPVSNTLETELHYPLSDPFEQRQTPLPSFIEDSLSNSNSSTNFTSVSQRQENPLYFENSNEYIRFRQKYR